MNKSPSQDFSLKKNRPHSTRDLATEKGGSVRHYSSWSRENGHSAVGQALAAKHKNYDRQNFRTPPQENDYIVRSIFHP